MFEQESRLQKIILASLFLEVRSTAEQTNATAEALVLNFACEMVHFRFGRKCIFLNFHQKTTPGFIIALPLSSSLKFKTLFRRSSVASRLTPAFLKVVIHRLDVATSDRRRACSVVLDLLNTAAASACRRGLFGWIYEAEAVHPRASLCECGARPLFRMHHVLRCHCAHAIHYGTVRFQNILWLSLAQ